MRSLQLQVALNSKIVALPLLMTQRLFDIEEDSEIIVSELDVSHLIIEDDTPVDNFQSEVQQRLLVEPLYSAKALPSPFLAAAHAGLFYKLKGNPIVPDVFLSLGVQRAEDLSQRRDRSYFVWEFGKVPDVCIEIVSNREGNELTLSQKSRQQAQMLESSLSRQLRQGKDTAKKDIYAQIGVPYYVVFDPLQQIQEEDQMNGALLRVWTLTSGRYSELTPVEGIAEVGSVWLETVGLGLTLWQGPFEEAVSRLWLRWCDRQGQVIPTGAELADTERQRAEAERQRSDRLAQKLQELGINPDEV